MKLKICGINDIDILEHACEAGLDFVGFIMVNESPRNISNSFLASLERFNFLSTTPVFVLAGMADQARASALTSACFGLRVWQSGLRVEGFVLRV